MDKKSVYSAMFHTDGPIMTLRRTILKAKVAVLALSLIPIFGSASKRRKKLTRSPAKAVAHLFYQGVEKSKPWLYNQSALWTADFSSKGDDLEITFVNQLDQPTTVHWHSVCNINAMDGVPGLTQDAVAQCDSFTYRFPLRDVTNFWYHAHNNALEQLARGLYGALIMY